LRCPRCGNENPVANRFCGMCGATLLQAPATAAAAVGQNPASVSRSTAESVAAATPVPTAVKSTPPPAAPIGSSDPVISGPSFLGLNQPEATARRRSNLSINPQSAPSSRSLDYLLEDEEPRGGGGWKFVLILVALALAVGFGYLRWKHQGLGWLISGTKSAPPATQTSEPADSSVPAPPSSGTASTSPPAANPTVPAGSPPAPADSTATPSSPAPASANPSSGTATSALAAPVTNPASSPAAPASKPETSTTGDAPKSDSSPPAAAESTVATVAKDSNPDASDDASPDAVAEKPKDVPVKPVAKPAAPVRPATADPVAEAQKYLYGRGARQDCERGIRLLKPAAAQSNSKAMIEMGALYSAGLCTPRDLPTAYRWFALALRKDPENQAVQTDLKKLWGEMTQPERQLAIRLSQ
jgi:hypothetical protein